MMRQTDYKAESGRRDYVDAARVIVCGANPSSIARAMSIVESSNNNLLLSETGLLMRNDALCLHVLMHSLFEYEFYYLANASLMVRSFSPLPDVFF
ncbi:hypothetical protein DPMN_155314 [Dreissena polymorpha]|uniref:Uncharacterized protein n=1 Tax=Dreissena polymorpha TaxID=45954 RepID=A0A9D4FRJ8_DREPO|nr:hypothetical protein DPMN_155314 [Dreissena polymorpha]